MVFGHVGRAVQHVNEKHHLHAKRTSTLGLSGRILRYTITFCAVSGFSLFGYDQGLMSGIVSGPEFCRKEFNVLCREGRDTPVLQAAVTACYEIGCFFGALFPIFFGERLGRKPIILAGCFIIIVGTVISTSAFGDHWGLGQFVIGRVITGIGNGFNTATIPVWQSEMSRPELRGKLVNLEGAVVAIGTMVAYWLDFGLYFIDSSIAWRLPVAVQIVFALLVMLLLIGLPESPSWLIGRGRLDEAKVVLTKLYATSPDDPHVEELYAAQLSDAKRAGADFKYRDLLTRGRTAYFDRMVIGMSTQFFQQYGGCNAAIYYSTILFKYMDLSETISMMMGGFFAVVYAAFTIPSFFLVEWLGRRRLFLLGATGQTISFLITMSCLTRPSKNNYKGGAVGLYLFIAFFGMSILEMPWVYVPEIQPMRTRTAAAAICTCTNWLANFSVVMFTPTFVNKTGWGAYLFFACMNAIWIPLIYLFYPETAGRRFEEMDIIFARAHDEGRFPFRVAKTMPHLNFEEIAAEFKRLDLGPLGLDSEGESDDDSSGSYSGSYSGSDERSLKEIDDDASNELETTPREHASENEHVNAHEREMAHANAPNNDGQVNDAPVEVKEGAVAHN